MFDAKARVLVVDDMLTMRKIIKKSLGELGLTEVSEANDGSTAWPMLEENHKNGTKFDVVLCDWNMPKLPGIELLKMVRADERFRELPFILVTAESDQTQVLEAIKLGVSHYVVKPFTTASLKDRLEQTHKRHQK